MESARVTPELKPLFGSADRSRVDRRSSWKDYFIAACAAFGLLLCGWGDRSVGALLFYLAVQWGTARSTERQSDLMDYFGIAVLAVCGTALWIWGRWWLAILPIGLGLHSGFTKWRERRSSGHD